MTENHSGLLSRGFVFLTSYCNRDLAGPPVLGGKTQVKWDSLGMFTNTEIGAGEPILLLSILSYICKKYEGRGSAYASSREASKAKKKREAREVNNFIDSWLFQPINRQIFCAKMPSASSSFLDRKILRQETAFPHHGKPSLLFLVRKLIRQRKTPQAL